MFRWVLLLIQFVPATIVAVGGALYIQQCLAKALDPNIPLEIELKGARETATLRLHTFRIVPATQTVEGQGLEVRDGARQVIAKAQSVRVERLDWTTGMDQRPRVHLRSAEVVVRRLSDLRWAFENLLPEPTVSPADVPTEVFADQVRVRLIDEASQPPIIEIFDLTDLRLAFRKDDWLAEANLQSRFGRLGFRAQQLENKDFNLNVTFPTELSLAPLLGLARRLPETRQQLANLDFAIDQAYASGSMDVWIHGATQNVRLQAPLRVRMTGLTAQRVRVEHIEGDIQLSDEGAIGQASIVTRFGTGNLQGQANWRDASGTASFQGNVPEIRRIPSVLRQFLHSDLNGSGVRISGRARLHNDKLDLSANLLANSVSWRQVAAQDLSASVHQRAGHTYVQARAQVRGADIRATGEMDPSQRIAGLFIAKGLRSDRFADLIPELAQTSMLADAEGRIAGTLSSPTLSMRTTASGAVLWAGAGQRIQIGRLQASGTWSNSSASINRFQVRSDHGVLVGSASVDGSGRIVGGVTLDQVPLGKFDPALGGQLRFSGALNGSLSRPSLKGRAEVYRAVLADQTFEAIRANVDADLERLRVDDVVAFSGATYTTAKGQVRWQDQRLFGKANVSRLQLSDWVDPDLSGSVEIQEIRVGGNLQSPVVSASVSGDGAVLGNSRVDPFRGMIRYADGILAIESFEGKFADGTWTANGAFDVAAGRGLVTLSADGLLVGQAIPDASRYGELEGIVDGTAELRIDERTGFSARAKGRIDDLTINGTPFGSGPWEVRQEGRDFVGDIEFGTLGQYVSATGLRFDPVERRGFGRIDLFNFSVEDIIRASLPGATGLEPTTAERLKTLTGDLSVGIDLVLDPSRIVADVNASVSRLRSDDAELGDLTLTGRAENERITVHEAKWDTGRGTIQASGSLDADGEVNLTGDIAQLQLGALVSLEPLFERIGGTWDVPFRVVGETRTPSVRMSVSARDILKAPSGTDTETPGLSLSVDTLELNPSQEDLGIVTLAGNYFYRGFSGGFEGSVPFRYGEGIDQNLPLTAKMTILERDLAELAQYFPGVHAEGKVGASASAEGPLDDLRFRADLTLNAQRLGFQPIAALREVGTELRDVILQGTIADQVLTLSLGAAGSRGGRVDGNLTLPVPELTDIHTVLRDGLLPTLEDNVLEGSLNLQRLRVREDFRGGGFVDGILAGQLAFGGPLNSPLCEGQITASYVESVLPGFPAEPAEGRALPIDVRFDVTTSIEPAARVRAATADLWLLGNARITGSLSEPVVRSVLQVDRGTMRLPGGLVRLDQGGTVEFLYDGSTPEQILAANLNVDGSTSLTAVQFGDLPERFEIQLGLRGDLLRPDGLQISATSDPPYLSSDRILHLLGRTDLITGLGGHRDGARIEEQLRSAIAGYALPTLFQPIGTALVEYLGLDYVDLDFDAFATARIAFSRSFGAGWSFVGRRQITEAAHGLRQAFDYRLVYRPRRIVGWLNRIAFSLGVDQDRPWKLGLDYGLRF